MSEITYRDPLFIQIREVIRSKIESGEYPPGTTIPSELDLAEMYGVSRLTIRTAIDALVYEGLLRRIQGKGAYVTEPKLNYSPEVFGGFRQNVNGKNIRFSSKVLYKTARPADTSFSHILGIEPEDDIYYIKRLCYTDGVPFMLNKLYIPCRLLPQFDEIDLNVFQPYEVYSMYGLNVRTVEQKLDLAYLHHTDCTKLGIDPGIAVMCFECTSRLQDGTAVEYSKSYARGDMCNYSIRFQQSPRS